MGCFDYRCCVTGLPIRAGDPIKYVLLTENPYDDRMDITGMGDYWFLRTWPLRAEYNDYGSIDSFDETSPGVWAVVEGLKKDLIEVGTGDNSCHDVPTKHGMPFEDILTAVQEGQVLVDSAFDPHAELHQRIDASLKASIWTKIPPLPVGLPTLQNIRALLEEKGFKVDEGRYSSEGADGYLVDEQDHGWVRIRCNNFEHRTEGLQKILSLLQEKFAAMLTAGSGNYADEVEMHVMPLPDKGQHLRFRQDREKKPLKLWQGMILTSAWDAICKQANYAKIRADVQAEWDRLATPVAPISALEILTSSMRGNGNSVTGLFFHSEVPFTMGLGEHMQLITTQHKKQPFSEQQIQDFLDDVAGLACLYPVLSSIHYWWKPSWYGGQDSQYKKDQKWHLLLADICKQLHQEQKRQQIEAWGDDEEEEDDE